MQEAESAARRTLTKPGPATSTASTCSIPAFTDVPLGKLHGEIASATGTPDLASDEGEVGREITVLGARRALEVHGAGGDLDALRFEGADEGVDEDGGEAMA